METQLGSNVKVSADFDKGDLVLKAEGKVGVVQAAEKLAEWVKSRRPGGVEDPIADGFVALIKQIAGEEPSEGGSVPPPEGT